MLYQSNYDSPVGVLTIVCNETHLLGLWIKGQKYYFGKLKEKPVLDDDQFVIQQVKQWLDAYFCGDQPKLESLQILFEGTLFQNLVWKQLCQIPFGETTTYGKIAEIIAKQLGKSHMSAQAVGGAVGHNPISIIVPCHRVLGKDGSLTGYAGGVDMKVQLLKHEQVL